ncbi:MAG: nickel pincer cofactor biosynthesis protein LarC [Nitrospirae bacterium]|nr:nickel pincer cofactor biosynthesis protein LarC [Nitrospirota bacterium]
MKGNPNLKTAYFDCSSGISGDMCLGALVDAGVSLKALEKELRKVPIKGYKLASKKAKRAGFRATKVDVLQLSALSPQPSAKKWRDIEKIIKTSKLSDNIKQKGLKIFKRLFEAEAKVHGERFDNVHLHELGAVDCIVDIFGTLIAMEILGIEKVYSSPVNLGGGFVKTTHGILPVPAPATLEILSSQRSALSCQLYSDGTNFELTTPTGTVIIKELASGFGNIPEMSIGKIGIGAGSKDFKHKANVLRIFVGESMEQGSESREQEITVIETNIDDMNPQVYEYVMERLFKAGALDVYLAQIIMKKGRPGIKLSVLCNDSDKENLMKIMFEETTTIGLRFYSVGRKTLTREIKKLNTKFGKINLKLSKVDDKVVRITPEYEDCKRLAKKLNLPLLEVIKSVSSAKGKK